MGSIDKYIFRTTLASFALVLVSLTGVIWITQALRGIDLMTSQGQTIMTFLGITSLVIPALVLIIAPIALMIAISHTLNKLATDSEIIVMNAAGFSPFRLFRPFFYATCVVALMVAFIAAYLAPDGMRRIKQWDAEITADVLTNILQPGRFAQLDQNLTIRIRERLPGGVLAGIFVDDRRDPKERVTIIAEHGTVVKNENGSFLVLEDGNLSASRPASAIPRWWRSAATPSTCRNSPTRATTSRSAFASAICGSCSRPSEDDPVYKQLPGQFRAELHDRFLAPIYPFAFAVLTFAFLGAPRTTRQSRNFSIGGSLLAVFGLRMAGFACSVMAVKTPGPALFQYAMVFAAIGDRAVDDHRRHRGRAAGRPDGSHQQVERAHRAAVRTAGRRMSMLTNTLGRYFAGRFVVAALGVFASIFLLLVLVDYIEMVRKTSGLASASAIMVARDLAVPRAAAAGKADAVLHADRRDDLLSRAVAPARTRGGARRRRLGLAVHLARARQRAPARRDRDRRLQSDVGEPARALQAHGSRAVRLGARRRHPGRLRLLAQPGQQRRPDDHQRRAQRAAGRPADRADRVPV